MSLQPLFTWMEKIGKPFSRKAYLLLCFVFLGTGLFAISMLGIAYIGLGIINIFFAINMWLSYQQRKIDEREDEE
jgi:predicted PurR-regulated permease PerM